MLSRFAPVLCVSLASACALTTSDGSSDDLDGENAAWGTSSQATTAAKPRHFLSQHGRGSKAEALAYYGRNIQQDVPLYTLERWNNEFIGSAPVVTGFYRNTNELGFWREMTCTATIGRGVGGCKVVNWQNATDPQAVNAQNQHVPNKGAVAMNLSPEGFARFYVFLPSGALSPSAVLDSEGPKFAPRMCTVCHGGKMNSKTNDLGAVFREFEPSLLEVRPGISQDQAEREWLALNLAIRGANQAIRSEQEGSPKGVDHAKAAMIAHVDDLYRGSPSPHKLVSDPSLVPASWKTDAVQDHRRTDLWTATVNRYCMGCHRINSLDWSDYGAFQYLQNQNLLRQYVGTANAQTKLPVMPQAELTKTNLAADASAQAAIDSWLTPCASGGSCSTGNPCQVATTSCATGRPVCEATGSAPEGTPCGAGLVCRFGSCVNEAPPPPPPCACPPPSSPY